MKSEIVLEEEWLNEKNHSKALSFSCVDECNDDHVEIFLKEQALELMQRNLVRTRLFFDHHQNLIGFYSLFNDKVKMNKDKRKALEVQLPQNVKDIPAIRLQYIGVDDEYRGKGHGFSLHRFIQLRLYEVEEVDGLKLIVEQEFVLPISLKV